MSDKLRILIVDDEFSARKLFEVILKSYGTCDLAEDGVEAVAKVQKALSSGTPYDLICLDIMMPGMDGQEALSTIRALEKKKGIWPGNGSKIIMTTALHDASNIMKAFIDQCESYLVKPIQKDKLVAELEKLGLL